MLNKSTRIIATSFSMSGTYELMKPAGTEWMVYLCPLACSHWSSYIESLGAASRANVFSVTSISVIWEIKCYDFNNMMFLHRGR